MAVFMIAVTAWAETKQFPSSPGWLTWLRIDYPARFEMDPKSFQGEAKWWAKFNDPDSELSLEINAFGYVNDLDLVVSIPGITCENYPEKLRDDDPIEELVAAKAKYKNIGDYFRAMILPKGCKEAKFPGYERFIQKKKDRAVIYFLDRSAYRETFGRCYQILTFTFPEDTYEMHEKEINVIIQGAKPPYHRRSEQDADQPATVPDSKSEGKQNPRSKPEMPPSSGWQALGVEFLCHRPGASDNSGLSWHRRKDHRTDG